MPVHQQRSPDAVKQSPGLKHQPLLFCVYTLFKKNALAQVMLCQQRALLFTVQAELDKRP